MEVFEPNLPSYDGAAGRSAARLWISSFFSFRDFERVSHERLLENLIEPKASSTSWKSSVRP
jgi:hypothetical protein